MPEPIRYQTQSDREVLIQVAEAVNCLNEDIQNLMGKVEYHGKIIYESKDRLTAQEVLVHDILKDNASVCLKTSETLTHISLVLEQHSSKLMELNPILKYTDKIDDLDIILKWWKWSVGIVASVLAGVLLWIITNWHIH